MSHVVVMLEASGDLIDIIGTFDTPEIGDQWIKDNVGDAEVGTQFEVHQISTP